MAAAKEAGQKKASPGVKTMMDAMKDGMSSEDMKQSLMDVINKKIEAKGGCSYLFGK